MKIFSSEPLQSAFKPQVLSLQVKDTPCRKTLPHTYFAVPTQQKYKLDSLTATEWSEGGDSKQKNRLMKLSTWVSAESKRSKSVQWESEGESDKVVMVFPRAVCEWNRTQLLVKHLYD